MMMGLVEDEELDWMKVLIFCLFYPEIKKMLKMRMMKMKLVKMLIELLIIMKMKRLIYNLL